MLPLAAIAVVVATANRDRVSFSFDPLPYSIDLPLYAVLFAGIAVGLVIGLIAEWWFQRRWRRDARLHRKLVQNLSVENERLKGEHARQIDAPHRTAERH